MEAELLKLSHGPQIRLKKLVRSSPKWSCLENCGMYCVQLELVDEAASRCSSTPPVVGEWDHEVVAPGALLHGMPGMV